MKLSRMKASELNIYARGSVHGVQAHLRELNKSACGIPDSQIVQVMQESNEHRPPINVQRIADWFNNNHQFLVTKNHLKRENQTQSQGTFYQSNFNKTNQSTNWGISRNKGINIQSSNSLVNIKDQRADDYVDGPHHASQSFMSNFPDVDSRIELQSNI